MPINNNVIANLQIRHDIANNWTSRNPVLLSGEYGLETDTFLIKVGDGLRTWTNLPYLNKLDSSFFKWNTDGTITFSDAFRQTLNTLQALAGDAIESLTITNAPTVDTDAANKKYVDDAIRAAGHLKREVVEDLLDVETPSDTVIYMVYNTDHYEEYMYINGAFDMVGTTGGSNITLDIATAARLGGVKSSALADHIAVDPNTGVMSLNNVSTSLLYVPTGDTLILNGGTA